MSKQFYGRLCAECRDWPLGFLAVFEDLDFGDDNELSIECAKCGAHLVIVRKLLYQYVVKSE